MDYYPKRRKEYSKRGTRLEYKNFRVKSAVKSFRDLEVYKATTQLAVEVFAIRSPKKSKLIEDELAVLRTLAKMVPKLIAESYGDKFSNFGMGLAKMERVMAVISNIIAKIDFFIASFEKAETKDAFLKLLKKYQLQRTKILNLKNAWTRLASVYNRSDRTDVSQSTKYLPNS